MYTSTVDGIPEGVFKGSGAVLAEKISTLDARDASPVSSKRDQIIDAALELFLDGGFDAVSMDAIAAKANVSKRTVYAHFDGKEALFSATMSAHCEMQANMPLSGDPPVGPPEAVLREFGRNLLRTILAPMTVITQRRVIADADRFPELSRIFWESGPNRAKTFLARYFEELHRQGVVVVPDPEHTALAFMGAVALGYFLPSIFGLRSEEPTDAEIDAHLDATVPAFLDGIRPRG